MNQLCTFFVMSLLLLFASFARAENNNCEEKHYIYQGIQFQKVKLSNNQCYITILPEKAFHDLVYRSYVFSSQHKLLVFNSFNDSEDDALVTGSKEFYFFPRLNSIVYEENLIQSFDVVADQFRFKFNPALGELDRVEGADLEYDPSVNHHNNGGVKLRPHAGLILELNFRRGGAPSEIKKSMGQFIDSKGSSCYIRVGDYFAIDANGDANLRYNDNQLYKKLKTVCPDLNWQVYYF